MITLFNCFLLIFWAHLSFEGDLDNTQIKILTPCRDATKRNFRLCCAPHKVLIKIFIPIMLFCHLRCSSWDPPKSKIHLCVYFPFDFQKLHSRIMDLSAADLLLEPERSKAFLLSRNTDSPSNVSLMGNIKCTFFPYPYNSSKCCSTTIPPSPIKKSFQDIKIQI